MIVYLSGLRNEYFNFVSQFQNMGVLSSFVEKDLYFEHVRYEFHHVMFDSGAYSISTGKAKVDINLYIEFLTSNEVRNAVNLDILSDGQKSFDNWKYINKKWSVMPVYHFSTDIKFLNYYAEKTDYIGLSATNREPSGQIRKYFDMILSKYQGYKFHLFGCTSIPLLTKYPIFSCDSTSWMNGVKMGWVITRYGNFFLNKGKNVPGDIELFLRQKYGLLTKEEYESEYVFGVAINKVNIYELNYLLCEREILEPDRSIIDYVF